MDIKTTYRDAMINTLDLADPNPCAAVSTERFILNSLPKANAPLVPRRGDVEF